MPGSVPTDATMLNAFQDPTARGLGIPSIEDVGSGPGTGSPVATSGDVKVKFFAFCEECPHDGVIGAKVGQGRGTLAEAQQDAADRNAANPGNNAKGM